MSLAEREHGIEARAFLVSVVLRGQRSLLSVDDSLSELALLAETAGLAIVGRSAQQRRGIHPRTCVGPGKLLGTHRRDGVFGRGSACLR